MDNVVPVNANDRAVSVAGKQAAHERGLVHRAFSVIVYDSAGSMLLQQRARSKYRFGLWSNACCSEPPGSGRGSGSGGAPPRTTEN